MAISWFEIPAGDWYGNHTDPDAFAQVGWYDHRDGAYWVAILRGPEIGEVELGYDHCSWHSASEAMEAADEWLAARGRPQTQRCP